MFQKWDEDGSGSVDAQELGSALSALGYSVTPAEAQAVVGAFDQNGDDCIQYEDFVGILCGNAGEGHAVTAVGHDLAFLSSGGGDETDRNAADNTFRWAGREVRKVQGSRAAAASRRSGAFDIADGRGADSLGESVRLSHDRKVAEVKQLFSASVAGSRDEAARAQLHFAGFGGGVGGGESPRSGDDGSVGADSSFAPLEGMGSVFLGPASDLAAAVPPLPLGTLRQHRDALSAREQREQAWQPLQLPLTTSLDMSLSARGRIPLDTDARSTGPGVLVDHEADPLQALPDTGRGAVVLGCFGGRRARDPMATQMENAVHRIRITAAGPLQAVLGLGGNAAGDLDVPQPAIAGTSGERVPMPLFSPLRSARRDDRFEVRRDDFLQRSGRDGGATSSRSNRSPQPQLHSQPQPQPEEPPLLQSGESAADRMRRAKQAKLERIGLGSVESMGAGSGGAGSGNVFARHVNVNDLRVRLQRAEGERTTFLIAPPPSVLTSHSAEDEGWAFASATRIAQTARRVPEQYFASLVKDDRLRNLREQEDDYKRRVESNVQLEREHLTMRDSARIGSKRAQFSAYTASIQAQSDADNRLHGPKVVDEMPAFVSATTRMKT